MGFAFDFENCTECRRCMIACSIEKTGTVSMEASRIQVVRSWPNLPALEVCRFEDCPGKPCIPVCPVDAITENGDMVLIDPELCTACGLCVDECPYNAIVQTGRKPALKCDFCGGDPKCVKECVTRAISMKES